MAHSYIYIKDKQQDRSLGSSDGTIYIYMYFMIKLLEGDFDFSVINLKNILIRSYKEQLAGEYWSMVDIKIREVYEDEIILKQFLIKLSELEKELAVFGEYIDHNILNNAPEVNSEFTKPIPVQRILDFINNIRWVLRVDNVQPIEEGFVISHTVLD